MELAYAFLAEAAESRSCGRFFVFGGNAEVMTSKQLPSVIPSLALLARLELSRDECRQPLEVSLVGLRPDGTILTPETTIKLGPVEPRRDSDRVATTILIVNITGILIRSYGVHKFTLKFGSKELGSVPFYSEKATEPVTPSVPKERPKRPKKKAK